MCWNPRGRQEEWSEIECMSEGWDCVFTLCKKYGQVDTPIPVFVSRAIPYSPVISGR